MLGEQGTERPVHLFCSIQFLDSHGTDQLEITFKQCLYGLTRVNPYAQQTFPDSIFIIYNVTFSIQCLMG